MKHAKFTAIGCACLMWTAFGCSEDVTEPIEDNSQKSEVEAEKNDSTATDDFFANAKFFDPTSNEIVANDAVNRFAIDYFAKASQLFDVTFEDTNQKSFSVSPLSATLCLALMANSTDNATTKAIAEMMCNSDISTLNTLCVKLLDYLPYEGNGARLTLANSAWYDTTVQPSQNYVTSIKDILNSEVHSINFKGNDAIGTINKWCSEKTEGLIDNAVRHIDPKTIAMLINALYFEGIWTNKFDKSKSFESTFYGINGNSTATMMADSRKLYYAEGNDFQTVSLPFGGGITEMILVLPNDGIDIVDFCNNLDADKYQQFYTTAKATNVNLTMPRFSTQTYGNITDILVEMGLPESATLDKSGIAYYDDIHYDIIQQTSSQFDEDGGKLAAVTLTQIFTSTGEMEKDRTVNLDFNRPFLYFVRNTSSGTILMAGRVCDI